MNLSQTAAQLATLLMADFRDIYSLLDIGYKPYEIIRSYIIPAMVE